MRARYYFSHFRQTLGYWLLVVSAFLMWYRIIFVLWYCLIEHKHLMSKHFHLLRLDSGSSERGPIEPVRPSPGLVTVAFYSSPVSYFVSIELMLRRLEKPITWFCSVAFRANKFSNKKSNGERWVWAASGYTSSSTFITYQLSATSTVVCNDSANGFKNEVWRGAHLALDTGLQ